MISCLRFKLDVMMHAVWDYVNISLDMCMIHPVCDFV